MAKEYGKAAPDANYETNAKFLLEIEGIAIMAFEKITMGDSEWGVIEGRTGIDELVKGTSSGLKKPMVITVEKHLRVGGADDVKEIIDWHNAGSKDRKSGAVAHLDRDGAETIRFNFKNAWIPKITPFELDASQDSNPTVFVFDLSIPEITLG